MFWSLAEWNWHGNKSCLSFVISRQNDAIDQDLYSTRLAMLHFVSLSPFSPPSILHCIAVDFPLLLHGVWKRSILLDACGNTKSKLTLIWFYETTSPFNIIPFARPFIVNDSRLKLDSESITIIKPIWV